MHLYIQLVVVELGDRTQRKIGKRHGEKKTRKAVDEAPLWSTRRDELIGVTRSPFCLFSFEFFFFNKKFSFLSSPRVQFCFLFLPAWLASTINYRLPKATQLAIMWTTKKKSCSLNYLFFSSFFLADLPSQRGRPGNRHRCYCNQQRLLYILSFAGFLVSISTTSFGRCIWERKGKGRNSFTWYQQDMNLLAT